MIQFLARRFALAAAVLLHAAVAAHVGAADLIRIENVVWGFDGNVVPHAFNPLSFEVYNDSADQAEFNLELVRSDGVKQVDASIIVPAVSLAPNTGRRVQMFPYILTGWSDWTLRWGRGEHQRFDLNQQGQLALGEPATVVCYDPQAVIPPGGGGLPRFDEAFFPVSVTGTSGLAGVVLDHDPRSWHESTLRSQAFLDWLHAGGTLHLLQASDGVYPQFEAPLEELNTPLDEFRVGAGLVIRHPITFTRLDRGYAESAMLPRQALQLTPEPEGQETSDQNFNVYQPFVNWDTSDLMFSRLRQMTQADHNWPLIYVMALVYLLVIFPGCWLIGRRRADYRVTYGVMIGAVVLFSMGFKSVGQRGYGEATGLHSMAIARPLGDGRLLIQQWTNLFVTDGDDYRITHPGGDGLLYSSGQTHEPVNGYIVNPPGGRFDDVDIPPFSSRTIASSAVLTDRPVGATAITFVADDSRLRDLRVRIDPVVSGSAREALVLYEGSVYTLSRQEDDEWLLRSGGVPLANFLRADSWHDVNYGMPFGWDDDPDVEELFETAMRPLLAKCLGIRDEATQNRRVLANDRARLFVYTDMPEELSPQCEYVDGNVLEAQIAGRVLYIIDVFPPDDGPAGPP